MFTPLFMLLLLVTPWAWHRLTLRGEARAAAAWGAGLLFLFTASGHFVQLGPMTQMLPPWMPARPALVIATGVLEVAIAAGLFLERTRTPAAWAAIAVLLLFFPVNVYAAFERVPFGGHAWGPAYLLARAPLQAIIIRWIWVRVLNRRLALRASLRAGARATASIAG